MIGGSEFEVAVTEVDLAWSALNEPWAEALLPHVHCLVADKNQELERRETWKRRYHCFEGAKTVVMTARLLD